MVVPYKMNYTLINNITCNKKIHFAYKKKKKTKTIIYTIHQYLLIFVNVFGVNLILAERC